MSPQLFIQPPPDPILPHHRLEINHKRWRRRTPTPSDGRYRTSPHFQSSTWRWRAMAAYNSSDAAEFGWRCSTSPPPQRARLPVAAASPAGDRLADDCGADGGHVPRARARPANRSAIGCGRRRLDATPAAPGSTRGSRNCWSGWAGAQEEEAGTGAGIGSEETRARYRRGCLSSVRDTHCEDTRLLLVVVVFKRHNKIFLLPVSNAPFTTTFFTLCKLFSLHHAHQTLLGRKAVFVSWRLSYFGNNVFFSPRRYERKFAATANFFQIVNMLIVLENRQQKKMSTYFLRSNPKITDVVIVNISLRATRKHGNFHFYFLFLDPWCVSFYGDSKIWNKELTDRLINPAFLEVELLQEYPCVLTAKLVLDQLFVDSHIQQPFKFKFLSNI